MQSASFEATFPIMGGLVWNRIFHAMYATPISPRDIALGNLAWIAARLTLISTIFTIVIVAFGAAASPLIVLAIPAAVLTGMAFAAPIAAFSATQKTPEQVRRRSSASGSRRCSCSRARSSRSARCRRRSSRRLAHAAVPRRRA